MVEGTHRHRPHGPRDRRRRSRRRGALLAAALAVAALAPPGDVGARRAKARFSYRRHGYRAPKGKLAATLFQRLRRFVRAQKKGAVKTYLALLPRFIDHEQRNRRISMLQAGVPSPAELKDEAMPQMITSVMRRRYLVGVKRNRVMAVLAFFQRDRKRGGGMLLFVAFYRERGSWKVGKFAAVPFKGKVPAPPESVRLLPKVPAAQPLLRRKPSQMGILSVFAYGYALEIKVNGLPQSYRAGGSSSGLLLGGLLKGRNVVELKYKRTGPAGTHALEVTIAAQKKSAKRARQVLKIKTKQPKGRIRRVFRLP